MQNKREFAPSFLLNLTTSGKGSRVFVNAGVYDLLQKVKLGDALYLQELTPEQVDAITAKGSGRSTPTHRITVLPGDPNFKPEGKVPAKTRKSAVSVENDI